MLTARRLLSPFLSTEGFAVVRTKRYLYPLALSTGYRRFSTIPSSLNSKPASIAVSSSLNAEGRPIFFDYQSTTPLDPRVVDKMLPLYTDSYGNPHSRSHAFGWEAEDLVEEARGHVARVINAQPKNIVFTSGATESNNMAIKGLAKFYEKAAKRQPKKNPLKNHIITTQVEHKCVLQSCRTLQDEGWDVTYLPVDGEGLVSLKDLERAIIPEKTLLCSIMHVNNEIGVVQDLKEIGAICRKNKVFFHTDAAQGFGKLPIDVEACNIDLLSISGHKIYGPKGIGALYVRSKPRVRLVPVIDGGGQERGFRSGTLPAPIIVGFGEASRIAMQEMEADRVHVTELFDRLNEGIVQQVPYVTLNGSKSKRYHGNLNISFAYIEGESMMMALPDFAVSSGSACTSASLEPSYVLRALGVDEALAHTSLRFGIGRFTTREEIDLCVDSVVSVAEKLRELSPLYEMALEEEATGVKTDMIWT